MNRVSFMKVKKLICLILAVLLVFSASSMNIVAFAGSGYPDGVTEKQAQNAVTGTEQLVSYILKNYLKTDLKTLIEPMIYSDVNSYVEEYVNYYKDDVLFNNATIWFRGSDFVEQDFVLNDKLFIFV